MLAAYCRIPSFLVIVLQGVFGCVAWASLSFLTLYLQVFSFSFFLFSFFWVFGCVAWAALSFLTLSLSLARALSLSAVFRNDKWEIGGARDRAVDFFLFLFFLQ